MVGNKKWLGTKNGREQKVFRKKNCLKTGSFANKKCSGAKSVQEQKVFGNKKCFGIKRRWKSLFNAVSL